MKMNRKYIIWCGIISCLALGCTKPYNPTIIAAPNNYLVVEGNINTGTDSTTIQLSRTTNLSSTITSAPVSNAAVTIQDNQNGTHSLQNLGNGTYSSGMITLDPARMYRINITTSDGNQYVSDYVPATSSPPIDSIGFTVKSNGIQVYVNTHDPNNNTHYYRWNYTETWEFHSEYQSDYVSDGSEIVFRTPAQQIYKCWTNDISTDIELGSSAKLTQDVIFENPLVFIPSTSEKLEDRYSILLKQYAMTSAGYNYYSLLRQNTEELGSIFDAQPSTLTGNIHCISNAGLPVIGYVTAGSAQQKRIYIDKEQLPNSFVTTYPYSDTLSMAYFNDQRSDPPGQNTVALYLIPDQFEYVPVNAILDMNREILGYTYSVRDCVDCSIRGATTPPSFWIAGPYN